MLKLAIGHEFKSHWGLQHRPAVCRIEDVVVAANGPGRRRAGRGVARDGQGRIPAEQAAREHRDDWSR